MNHKHKLTVFVVDDNPAALETLANDLREQPEIGKVLTFSNYAEATLPFIEEQADVLFLDVEMPGKSGIEFLQSIQPKVTFTFKAVFYSGFSNYMLDAIRHSAFDFLLKPYKLSELRTIIDRLMQTAPAYASQTAMPTLRAPQKIAMQTMSELLLITVDQILMFDYSSINRTWELTLTDMSRHPLKKGITAKELQTLSPTLVPISNTNIINLTYLVAVENSTQRCRLCPPFDKINIIASRRYFSKLKERLELL